MIIKNIFQILGIVLFFFLIGYVLTYPYELSYQGNESVTLFEESYQKTSLEEILGIKELKGKILYVRIWEPFDTEVRPYTELERDSFRRQLQVLKNDSTSKEYRTLSAKLESNRLKRIFIEEQHKAIESIRNKFKDKDVAFVFIADPDNDFTGSKDDFRKWKTAVKKHKIPGYHLIMNRNLAKHTRQYFQEIPKTRFLPKYFLVDKEGEFYSASYPEDTTKVFLQINELLQNNLSK